MELFPASLWFLNDVETEKKLELYDTAGLAWLASGVNDIAMSDLGFEARLLQILAYGIGHHDGTMLAAGTAEGDGEITLPFANVMWQ